VKIDTWLQQVEQKVVRLQRKMEEEIKPGIAIAIIWDC
jgi:G:T-mismatch repair DNA endonuclease (very short patch repair protein)